MLKIWEPPLYLTAKTLYDAITIAKPTFAIPAMKKTRTRLRRRTRVADTVAEQQIDTAAAAASEFFALPVLRVDLRFSHCQTAISCKRLQQTRMVVSGLLSSSQFHMHPFLCCGGGLPVESSFGCHLIQCSFEWNALCCLFSQNNVNKGSPNGRYINYI